MHDLHSLGLYAIPRWCRLANLEVHWAVLQELHWQNTQEVETAEFQYYCHGFVLLFLSEQQKKGVLEEESHRASASPHLAL